MVVVRGHLKCDPLIGRTARAAESECTCAVFTVFNPRFRLKCTAWLVVYKTFGSKEGLLFGIVMHLELKPCNMVMRNGNL